MGPQGQELLPQQAQSEVKNSTPLDFSGGFRDCIGQAARRPGQRSWEDTEWRLKMPLLVKEIQDNDAGTEVNRSQNGVDNSHRARSLAEARAEVEQLEMELKSRNAALNKARAMVFMKERDVQAVGRELEAAKKRIYQFTDVQHGDNAVEGGVIGDLLKARGTEVRSMAREFGWQVVIFCLAKHGFVDSGSQQPLQ